MTKLNDLSSKMVSPHLTVSTVANPHIHNPKSLKPLKSLQKTKSFKPRQAANFQGIQNMKTNPDQNSTLS
jgi:hypothetical protein